MLDTLGLRAHQAVFGVVYHSCMHGQEKFWPNSDSQDTCGKAILLTFALPTAGVRHSVAIMDSSGCG